jgi:hypothetical protein
LKVEAAEPLVGLVRPVEELVQLLECVVGHGSPLPGEGLGKRRHPTRM